MKYLAKITFAVSLILIISCKQKSNDSSLKSYFKSNEKGIKTGGIKIIPIETPKGKFNIWTKTVGNNPTIKVLLLNGIPVEHMNVLNLLKVFSCRRNRIYLLRSTGLWQFRQPQRHYYVGFTTLCRRSGTSTYSFEFNERQFLFIYKSWGGILAMEYALKYQQNLKGLIISNMMSSCPDYGKYAEDVLSKQMPTTVLAEVRALEAKKDFENPRYMELLIPNYYEKHILRKPYASW
jgi:proline iminopeptidase